MCKVSDGEMTANWGEQSAVGLSGLCSFVCCADCRVVGYGIVRWLIKSHHRACYQAVSRAVAEVVGECGD